MNVLVLNKGGSYNYSENLTATVSHHGFNRTYTYWSSYALIKKYPNLFKEKKKSNRKNVSKTERKRNMGLSPKKQQARNGNQGMFIS